MKTNELINLLSTNVEPVDGGVVARAVSIAVLSGVATAIGLILLTLGVRADFNTDKTAR